MAGSWVVTTGGAPTKTLREAALHLTGFRERALYGLTAPADIALAVERMRARTAQVRSEMQEITRSFFDDLRVDVAYGSARLGPARTVILTPRDGDGKECVLTAERILLATGSRPSRPPNIPFDDPDVFDSEGLPKLQRIPESVLIVGGGSIGCEFVSIFNAFGIPVTLVQTGDRLLREMDSEMSQLLCQVFEKFGIHLLFGKRVSAHNESTTN